MASLESLRFGLFESRPAGFRDVINALRQNAERLRATALTGGYSDKDVHEFWQLIAQAPSVLLIDPDKLSVGAGLGANYFRTVVKEQRYPKLHNYLKALSVVIMEAKKALADASDPSTVIDVAWIQNPYQADAQKLADLQRDLLNLIQHIKQSNSLCEIPELDEVWRKNLVVILETTLEVLKAPLVERGLLRKAKKLLLGLSVKTAADARAAFVGALAAAVAAQILS